MNNEKKVFRLPKGGAWQLKSIYENAVNIAVGNGNVFILTTATVAGENTIKKWNGSTFVNRDGGFVDIHADALSRPAGANHQFNIFKYTLQIGLPLTRDPESGRCP